jgi:hypothetical protein
LGWGIPSFGDPLSIYNVQWTEDASGQSPYHDSFQNVAGGVVTHIEDGFRYYLQDPAYPNGWGGICVKDFAGELGGVEVGDLVNFTHIYVEDYRGTTFLQYDRVDNPLLDFEIQSHGNPVPAPLLLTADQLAAPVEDPLNFWMVDDRRTEPYESMLVTLENLPNLTVGTNGFGKADDIYGLFQGTDTVWATDYFQAPTYDPYYDPRLEFGVGQELESITGIVEQYLKITDTYGWDYYQVCTRSPADLVVPEPGAISLLLTGLLLAGRRRR